ncbi:interferon alpha/beta receptor 2-like isoform X2 [Hypomesus transpacificus]|uniref:interferon alpha/beta receptor 2-like isoform X2 n=1 Tax=Hypomesus transpacificus TaxID=137520 RepID=UPI001F07F576|nr:interferon alpha/beta receptor 2-like isoform X2 [Hypomesus transpacificus]
MKLSPDCTTTSRQRIPLITAFSQILLHHDDLPGPGLGQRPVDSSAPDLRRNLWKPVKGCELLRISQTCNLTKAFKDPLGYYQARVQAFTPTKTSNWTLSSLFHPLTETVVGPPGVAVSGCGNCLLLKLTPPADRGRQLSFLYRDFTCQVQKTRDGSQFSLWVVSTKETVIDYLEPGAEYCLTAVASSVLNPHVMPSEPHCVFTSPPASSYVPMFLGVLSVFCLLGALFTGAVVYTGHLLCLAKPLPKTLSSIPLIGWNSHQQQQLEVYSQISVLSPGCSEWGWVLRDKVPLQKTSPGEEEEEDEGYGRVISSE